MMLKRIITAIVLVLLCFKITLARVMIDIDSPEFSKIPIAITSFSSNTKTPDSESFSRSLSETLSSFLELTGYFHIIPRKAFLSDPTKNAGIIYEDWRTIGADYITAGRLDIHGKVFKVEMELHDVVKGEKILQKTITIGTMDAVPIAQNLASEILQTLTGDGRIFFTTIAFILRRDGETEIYTIPFHGQGIKRITDLKSLTLSPRWSTDGRYLAFTSYHGGNPEVYVKELKNNSLRKIPLPPGLKLPGSWAPNGKSLLLSVSFEGNQEICNFDLTSGTLTRLTYDPAIDVSPVWSPDGKWIAFVSNRSGSPQIYTMDHHGQNVRRLTYEGDYNTSPAWSPSGNTIAYVGRSGGNFQIFLISTDGETNVQLTDGNPHEHPSWSPDGRYLVCVEKTPNGPVIAIISRNGSFYRRITAGESPSWSPFITH
ncbi:MAG: Tol-Pal system beta propeller repeat protein TolB [Syntrophales bacterium]|nr:Tol-Pal system beta propeller repeat protein TolB [Syntrophales bacterium]